VQLDLQRLKRESGSSGTVTGRLERGVESRTPCPARTGGPAAISAVPAVKARDRIGIARLPAVASEVRIH